MSDSWVTEIELLRSELDRAGATYHRVATRALR